MTSVAPPDPPRVLTELSDDTLLAALCRTPLASHDALRVTCRRLRAAVGSEVFRRERRECGWAEAAVVVAASVVEERNPRTTTFQR